MSFILKLATSNGVKRPNSEQNPEPENVPENIKKPKLEPSIISHNNTPITPGCSNTPPGQELCADSAKNPVVAQEKAKKNKLKPSIDPYYNAVIVPGCSKTPPGQELTVAYKRAMPIYPELCETLLKDYKDFLKTSPRNSGYFPEIDIGNENGSNIDSKTDGNTSPTNSADFPEMDIDNENGSKTDSKTWPRNSADFPDFDIDNENFTASENDNETGSVDIIETWSVDNIETGSEDDTETGSEDDTETGSEDNIQTGSEDNILPQQHLWHINNIAHAGNFIRIITEICYHHNQSTYTGNVSKKKDISGSVYNNSLPVKKSSDDKMDIQQTQAKVPNINKQPKKKCVHDTECLPVKKENLLCLKRKFIEFEDMPKKVSYTCVHDDILDVEKLVKKIKMLCIHKRCTQGLKFNLKLH